MRSTLAFLGMVLSLGCTEGRTTLPESQCAAGEVEMYDGSCSDEIPEGATVISPGDVGGDFESGTPPTFDESDNDVLTAEACCIPAVDPYGRSWLLGACWLPEPAPPMLWGCGCAGYAVYWDYYANAWLYIYPPTPYIYAGYTCVVE